MGLKINTLLVFTLLVAGCSSVKNIDCVKPSLDKTMEDIDIETELKKQSVTISCSVEVL